MSHFVADYVFQTNAIAVGKDRISHPRYLGVNWWYWLTTHAIAHGIGTYIVTGSNVIMVLEIVVHWFIDLGKVNKWYGLHVDQALHIGCKAAWVIIYFWMAW